MIRQVLWAESPVPASSSSEGPLAFGTSGRWGTLRALLFAVI